ncbi:ABC transporter ATP-binding protein [Sphaerisporangium sp. NPDC051017]|uniref:ABC transporter ATP-binding protein n=1 Tax=unclassified Sphaerisporangium TaxID=2630420 RepID=UPI0033CD337E
MPAETISPAEAQSTPEAAGASPPVVELRQVRKVYPGTAHPAVDDVSIIINEGEFFSILGSSGSGKTTTLRMIAGFEQPTGGQVLLSGVDVSGVPANHRDVNTVFQNYALFPHMKVRANVAYPLKMKRVSRAEIGPRVQEALERVDMASYADRLPHQLSGGQRQRIALARALVGRPRLLLLDEPLGALDFKLRESMLGLLKRLQREVGITFVYVTHDQGEALAMSDKVAVMSKGRVEQIGTPQEIYRVPATSFVAGFIGKTNLLRCQAAGPTSARSGSMRFATSSACSQGTFSVSVRPEAIVVGDDARSCANHFSGVVDDVAFLGHVYELQAVVGDQRLTLRVDEFNGARGDVIDIGWSAEATVVVEEAGP